MTKIKGQSEEGCVKQTKRNTLGLLMTEDIQKIFMKLKRNLSLI